MTAVAEMPVITREGSSLRTDQELSLLFIEDVASIAHGEDPDDYADATEINCEGLHALNRGDSDELYWLCDEAEKLLHGMGFYVEWYDGYEIYREA